MLQTPPCHRRRRCHLPPPAPAPRTPGLPAAAAAAAMLRFRGAQCFRQRLVCATITGRPIRIDDIRADDQSPGLRDYEASLLRLLEKVTNGCIIEINETGAAWRDSALVMLLPGCRKCPGRLAGCLAMGSSLPAGERRGRQPGQEPGQRRVCRRLVGAYAPEFLTAVRPARRHQPPLQARFHRRWRPGAGARLRLFARHRLLPGAAGPDRAVGQEAADHHAAGDHQRQHRLQRGRVAHGHLPAAAHADGRRRRV